MKTIICLIWNNNDTYDRYWVRNHGEEKEKFIARMKKNYSDPKWNLEFFEAEEI